tara:strand:+ start:275 stop:583 length:309 start_codon:yes stop_codon:yes gene_type:complete
MEDPNNIKTQVESIEKFIKKNRKNMSKDDFDKKVKKEFMDFNLKYPALFEKTLEGTLDKKQFYYMLNMMGKISKDELTDHEASVQVGQVLVDKYVKPALNKE